MNETQCSFHYEMWQCPRLAVWEGLCRVHAASHLKSAVTEAEINEVLERQSHG